MFIPTIVICNSHLIPFNFDDQQSAMNPNYHLNH